MRISSVQHAVPSRVIDNNYVLDRLVASNSEHLSEPAVALMRAEVEQFLESAGTQRRYKLANGESGIKLALDAARRALDAADVGRLEVDFVLYVGVGRGWVEPAVANVIQHQLGLARATGFDILDACTSWMRALHVAHNFISTGAYRCGLIVNCECGFVTYEDWRIGDLRDLDHRLAEWTIGEAATATVVTGDRQHDDFYFNFKTFGEHFAVCLFPLPAVAERFMPGLLDQRHVPMRLFALSGELMRIATGKIAEVFASDARLCAQRYDIIFGHAASEKATAVLSRRLGIPRQLNFATHARYGNTVSASIPLGMSLALEEGRLQRGQKVLLMAAASGITIGLASFTF
jgi:3-oxoacyl-[acyl-carrier-protein] synthase III